MPFKKGGTKRGGRQKGTRNKVSAELIAVASAGGEMPLAYMLRVMRDATVDHFRRDVMAGKAAPYLHAHLATDDRKPTDAAVVINISARDARVG